MPKQQHQTSQPQQEAPGGRRYLDLATGRDLVRKRGCRGAKRKSKAANVNNNNNNNNNNTANRYKKVINCLGTVVFPSSIHEIPSSSFLLMSNSTTDAGHMPQLIPEKDIAVLEQSCQLIQHQQQKNSSYGGWWCKYSPVGFNCASSVACPEPFNEIRRTMLPYLTRVLRLTNPRSYCRIKQLDEKFLFPIVCINTLKASEENRISKKHLDSSDFGVSLLVYVGQYVGGNLEIEDREVETRRGDLVVLRGNKYHHRVLPVVSGVRISVVFFCHHDHFHKQYYPLDRTAAIRQFRADGGCDDHTDSDDNDQYEVERILGHKEPDFSVSSRGLVQSSLYHVKWVGFTDTSWEPYQNFNNKAVINDYWRNLKNKL